MQRCGWLAGSVGHFFETLVNASFEILNRLIADHG